ncbi:MULTISPECIES: TIGR03986 family CRISPR-associated RAMP protein [Spirulina sp. CCY15215]|uniref:TIGR03986 family type III CRISPR-associated RAMP protein n=1 Tax=Spirulina sp. CCY15215 TaxID=2767591 RepID=UPI00194F6F98|nr:TIGR03986 family CRISPR-associated RAMP protein [Spirulina major]
MSFPKHLKHVPESLIDNKGKKIKRQAIAPYNFVELPDRVVPIDRGSLPSHDRYYTNLHTGKIDCILTTFSPLYIRCGLTPSDFAQEKSTSLKDLETCSEDERARRSDFFKYPNQLLPTIPGSSLRGMLRSLVEILSFSKIDRVADVERLFFRAVAGNPKTDSLAQEYKNHVDPQKIQAGYLNKDDRGWYIQPAKTIQHTTFAWVKESETNLPKLKKFNSPNYQPQYIPVSYQSVGKDSQDRAKRIFAHGVDSLNIHNNKDNKGILVTSGNMKQGTEPSPRRNYCLVFDCVVFEKSKNLQKLRIDDIAIEHYCNALTDFQKDSPFHLEKGIFYLEDLETTMLEKGRPIFYYPPKKDDSVRFFGQSPNFRIPYSSQKDGRASTVMDFIPHDLRDSSILDIANSIFGFVNQEKQEIQVCKGRVSVSDAKYKSDDNGIFFGDSPIVPHILGSPKSTTFQHYLVQPEETGADKAKLKHYASQPPIKDDSDQVNHGDTVIRGHKLYWHKKNIKLSQILHKNQQEINDAKSQYTEIKPVQSGVSFQFSINFENLNDIELGALLWVLKIAQDDEYRISLGMGKPLGMGAVKITSHLSLNQRNERYSQLFDGDRQSWFTGYEDSPDLPKPYIETFDKYICKQIGTPKSSLKEVRRIKMLLAMLSWDDAPSSDNTRYMEIERDASKPHLGTPKKGKVNEYADRPVLPTPLQVIGWEKDNIQQPQRKVMGIEGKTLNDSHSSSKFSEGQEITAKVVNIQVTKEKKRKTILTYEIEGSECQATEEIYKREVSLINGDLVKVTIIKVKENNIRKVKLISKINTLS